MAVIQCPAGHYYDDQKNTSCPYCEKLMHSHDLDFWTEDNEKLTIMDESDEYSILTEYYTDNADEEQKTINVYEANNAPDCVTGWLVCVQGELKGKSFTLHHGWNYAGRSLGMDICMSGDLLIARERHLAIVYDEKNISFYVVPINGIVSSQGEVITKAYLLDDGTVLDVGNSKYAFVPYCRKGRVWE